MRRFVLIALALGASLLAPGTASAISLNPIAGGFNEPMQVIQPKGGDILVVEKRGVIRAVDSGDNKLATPFLDIAGRVREDGERGLLSVAFPPDYPSNRRFYVNYTNNSGDIEVDEFRRSVSNPDVALASSRRRVIVVRHRAHANHNGGQLQFDSLGRLYFSTGDGGGAGDEGDNARRKTRLLGKILRIDPRATSRRSYRIPRGNPFLHRFGRNEIFSYGLRNPYRYTLYTPPGGRTRIIIADVGQNAFEEVDYELLRRARGRSFGWPGKEGFSTYDRNRLVARSLKPTFAYSHAGGRCAVIGGEVVRNSNLPTLEGRYLYADLCAGQIRSFVPRIHHSSGDASIGVSAISQPSSFGHDAQHRYYVTSLDGNVYRISP